MGTTNIPGTVQGLGELTWRTATQTCGMVRGLCAKMQIRYPKSLKERYKKFNKFNPGDFSFFFSLHFYLLSINYMLWPWDKILISKVSSCLFASSLSGVRDSPLIGNYLFFISLSLFQDSFKNHIEFQSQIAWYWNLALPFPSYVTLAKFLNLSAAQSSKSIKRG